MGTRAGMVLFVTWWSIANMLTAAAQGVRSMGFFRFALGLGEAGRLARGVEGGLRMVSRPRARAGDRILHHGRDHRRHRWPPTSSSRWRHIQYAEKLPFIASASSHGTGWRDRLRPHRCRRARLAHPVAVALSAAPPQTVSSARRNSQLIEEPAPATLSEGDGTAMVVGAGPHLPRDMAAAVRPADHRSGVVFLSVLVRQIPQHRPPPLAGTNQDHLDRLRRGGRGQPVRRLVVRPARSNAAWPRPAAGCG